VFPGIKVDHDGRKSGRKEDFMGSGRKVPPVIFDCIGKIMDI